MKCINSYEQQKIVQLEKQLDWLAEQLSSRCICPTGINKCSDKQPISNCKSKWLEAARKATEV